jgi:hypothetical protein
MNIGRCLTRVALASAVTVAVSAVPSTTFASGFKVPFTDPYQVGSLTLCNQHLRPITSGSLLSFPFVWRAVSSAHVPAGYTRATLYVYQPIQHVDPGAWTGYQLTADALFSNPAHPMAQATYGDNPLIWPDQSMPPYWDGLYELRMYFSGAGESPWTSSYPAAVIKVTGYTWALVQGGGSSCTDGKAESVESFLLPRSKTVVPRPPVKVTPYADRTTGAKGKKGESASPSTTSASTTQAAGGSSTTTTSVRRSASAGTSSRGGGTPASAIAGGVIAALVLAGAVALLAFRRRRRLA